MPAASSHPLAGLQKVAMGLVIVLVDPVVAGFDALPDVLGWILALFGLSALSGRIGTTAAKGLVALAVVAGVVSIAGVRPGAFAGLPESAGWALSLPQIAFSYLLCSELAQQTGAPLEGRFRLLSRVFVVVGIGPALVYGGGIDALLAPLALLAVAAGVYLVYLLFRASLEVVASDEPTGDLTAEGQPDEPTGEQPAD